MPSRVSHSVLDPYLTQPVKARYRRFHIPAWLPPEALVGLGHLSAMAAAVGFAFSTRSWWGGLLAAAGVAGNHLCDVLDGTHARTTGQCRNGGELLDHFTDPLSFAYYLVGIAVSCGRLDLGLAAVICLFATAVLTNIKAKLTGQFTLAAFGPTEFKALLVLDGLALSILTTGVIAGFDAVRLTTWIYAGLVGVGIAQLALNLVRAVRDVNRHGKPADTTEWVNTQGETKIAA